MGGKSYIYTHRNRSALGYIRDHSLEKFFVDAITQEDKYPNKMVRRSGAVPFREWTQISNQ